VVTEIFSSEKTQGLFFTPFERPFKHSKHFEKEKHGLALL
jgi:hypothetical protein